MFDRFTQCISRHFPLSGYCFQCQQKIAAPLSRLLCANCSENLPYFPAESFCFFCNESHDQNNCAEKHLWEIDHPLAMFLYQPPISHWLLLFKYHGNYLAGRLLRELFVKDWKKVCAQYPPLDWVVPMPMNYWRAVRNGVNVSAYFAEELGLPVSTHLVRKKFGVQKQVGKNRKERENLYKKNILTISNKVANKNLLILDDVCTTGATANNLAGALKKAGANKVFFLCLCREQLS